MLQGYRLFDADAHAMMSPRMWETLAARLFRAPAAADPLHDVSDMGRWTNGWLVEGQIIPHALGPGSQPGNEPARVLEEFGAETHSARISSEWFRSIRSPARACAAWITWASITRCSIRPRSTRA